VPPALHVCTNTVSGHSEVGKRDMAKAQEKHLRGICDVRKRQYQHDAVQKEECRHTARERLLPKRRIAQEREHVVDCDEQGPVPREY
jgi:hypothetical protein